MKTALICSLCFVLCATTAGGVFLSQRSSPTWQSYERLSSDLTTLREEVQGARDDLRRLSEQVRGLLSAEEAPASRVAESRPAPAADAAPAEPRAAVSDPDNLKTIVLSAFEEERKEREEEHRREREQLKQRLEARQKEIAALGEGPYERYNLKVNSMASVLSLTDAQKQTYYDLTKGAADKLSEARKKLGEQAAAQKGAEDAASRPRSKDGEGRAKMKELYDGVQKEFADAVQGLLTPAQLEIYNQLSDSARTFQSREMVTAGGGGRQGRPGRGFALGQGFSGAGLGPGGERTSKKNR